MCSLSLYHLISAGAVDAEVGLGHDHDSACRDGVAAVCADAEFRVVNSAQRFVEHAQLMTTGV